MLSPFSFEGVRPIWGFEMVIQTRRVSSFLLVSAVAATSLMGMMSCGGEGSTSDEMLMAEDVPVMLLESSTDPNAIRPLTIQVPDEVLADLQARLSRTRLPDQIPGTGWDYGSDLSLIHI